jgi:WD40 repeat protein
MNEQEPVFGVSTIIDRARIPSEHARHRRSSWLFFRTIMAALLLPLLYYIAASDLLSLFAQNKYVDCVVFSPDSHYLAARLTSRRGVTPSGWNQTIRRVQLFSLEDSPQCRSLTCYSLFLPGTVEEGHSALAFSPDGNILAIARDSKRGGVDMWDSRTDELHRIGTSDERCCAVSFLSAATVLATVEPHTLTIHNLEGGQQQQIARQGTYGELAALPDGKTLIVGPWGAAEVWRSNPLRLLFKLAPSGSSISVSPDGILLATSSSPTSEILKPVGPTAVYLFDLRRGKAAMKFDAAGPATVSFSPDGCLAVACGSRIQLVDPTGIAPTRTFSRAGAHMTSVTISPDGQLLAGGDDDGSVTVWDIKTGTRSYRLSFQDNRFIACLSLCALGLWFLFLCWGKRRWGLAKETLSEKV